MKLQFDHDFLIAFTETILFDVNVHFHCQFDNTVDRFDGELFNELFPKLLMKCLFIKNDKEVVKKEL